ncbi:hypothetical protein LUZ61_020202 [Rhynchospora tenuis]|uniref:Agenet domain-containing protein n=1 Tax=Rhynchospora tenuis TaxID=198213 RepID=A0AAD6ENK7_9POAL|nr:hypothetical protein LUZ61_020202 [Rhynchospora tenuis]
MVLTSKQEVTTNAPPPGQKIDGELSISPKTPSSDSSTKPFSVGAEVEVRISSEGFYGSWYEATVLGHYRVDGHAKYKVQYVEFVLEEGSEEKLVEDVLAKDVRPRAPRRFSSYGPSFSIPNNEYEDPDIRLHDLVEAFHNDGWWHGVISGLRSPNTGLYTVSFPNSREVFQFKPTDIRPQLTFANSLWSPVLRIPQKTEAYKEGDKVDVCRARDDYGESWFCARVEKVIHHSYFLVEYESPNAHPNGDLTEILDPQHLRPAVDCMPGEILYTVGSHVEVFRREGWCPGVVSSGLSGSSYGVTVEFQGEQVMVQFHVSNMRLRLKWDGRRWSMWVSPSKAMKRKSVNSDEISASDVSLTESVTTPDSVTSPGKKLKMERKDSLESDDEVPITKLMRVLTKSSKSIGNSRPIKHAVQKVSRSRKLPTGLKDFRFKASTAKRSITCKRNLNGWAPDAFLPLSKNWVSTYLSPNSEFNQHTLAEHTLDKSVAPENALPFVVTSTLWKSLETTPVFVRIPQRPHFKMLESECEEEREGKAIGMMVTYAKLVDSIPRLKIHTELKVIEEKIACLDSLGKNGFVVDPMRSCLCRLLQIKTNCSKFSLQRVELETKLAKEKDSLASANGCEDKLADINKSIAKLKEQLSIMEKQKKSVMEKRAGVSGSAAELEHNISRIEVEIVSINRAYELASEEFDRVISRLPGVSTI